MPTVPPGGRGGPTPGDEGSGRGQAGLQSDGGCRGSGGGRCRPPRASWKRRNLEVGKAFPPCPQMSGAFVSRTFQKFLMLQLRHSERRVSPGPVGAVTALGKDHIAGMLRGVERTQMPTSRGKLLGDWAGWAHGSSAPVPDTGAQSAGLPLARGQCLLSQGRAQGTITGWAAEGCGGRAPGLESLALWSHVRADARRV